MSVVPTTWGLLVKAYSFRPPFERCVSVFFQGGSFWDNISGGTFTPTTQQNEKLWSHIRPV